MELRLHVVSPGLFAIFVRYPNPRVRNRSRMVGYVQEVSDGWVAYHHQVTETVTRRTRQDAVETFVYTLVL
jgi:hypothetical protein